MTTTTTTTAHTVKVQRDKVTVGITETVYQRFVCTCGARGRWTVHNLPALVAEHKATAVH